jgi:hypothetical protein
MVTRKELTDFTAFCLNKYKLEIDESIVQDYVEYNDSENQPHIKGKHKDEKIECDLNGMGCTHIAINSSKCAECII